MGYLRCESLGRVKEKSASYSEYYILFVVVVVVGASLWVCLSAGGKEGCSSHTAPFSHSSFSPQRNYCGGGGGGGRRAGHYTLEEKMQGRCAFSVGVHSGRRSMVCVCVT